MQNHRQTLALAVVIAAVTAGCYSPSIIDCSIVCGVGGLCPEGTACGTDNRCHVDAIDSCNPVTMPDGAVSPPDARREIDAAIRPDAAPPPPPDAPTVCPGAATGEPDDQCPGEKIGPVVEGTTVTVGDRDIFPAHDVDVYAVPTKLKPPVCTTNQILAYAMRVTLTAPDGTDLRLRRYTDDRICNNASARSGETFCVPFVVPCATASTVSPTFFFGVDGNGSATAVCEPYSVAVHLCAAGSTCDSCKANGGPGPN
jgi:hypothetical protein